MEKRRVCFARKLILVTGLFFLLLIWPSVKAEAAEVNLTRGDIIWYGSHHTYYYYVDGHLAYCLEPDRSSPGNGAYSSEEVASDSLLAKAMYYMYGGPGYETYIKDSMPDGWTTDDMAFAMTHCVLAYIYDGCVPESSAFIGLDEETKAMIVAYAERVKGLPDIPEADLTFSETNLTAYYDRGQKCQRTQSMTCNGEKENGITIPLPEGVTLVNETKGTTGTGEVRVSGGDTFFLKADVAYGNGTTWNSGEIRGEITNVWRTLVVKTADGKQDIGTTCLKQIESNPIALQVKWIDKPELLVKKNADRAEKKYKLGDIITYTADITQQIEKTVAKNVAITDTILTEGVKLQENSIILLNEKGEKIPEAEIVVQENSYTIYTNGFLEGIESGQKYMVQYQVAIEDESLVGKEIENEVVVKAENAEEAKDKETVTVEKEPDPEEPSPEEPSPEEPTQETPAKKASAQPVPLKASTVKTGDVANITGIGLILILSCTVIVLCGTMDARRKAKKNHKKH